MFILKREKGKSGFNGYTYDRYLMGKKECKEKHSQNQKNS